MPTVWAVAYVTRTRTEVNRLYDNEPAARAHRDELRSTFPRTASAYQVVPMTLWSDHFPAE